MTERLKTKPLTIELSFDAQEALFVTLYSVLHDSTETEMRSGSENREYWMRMNRELRNLFIGIAKNLKREDEINTRDRLFMGLIDLLSEDDIKNIASDPTDRYFRHARYLLSVYKK